MRAIIQRVCASSVTLAAGAPVSTLAGSGAGLMVLLGIGVGDTAEDLEYICNKILRVRVFANPPAEDGTPGKMWMKNVTEVDGGIMLVSQFTLMHVLKGNKPDFHNAMSGEEAKVLFDEAVARLGKAYDPTRITTGAFGQHMHVALVNDGPVTLTLDSKNKQ